MAAHAPLMRITGVESHVTVTTTERARNIEKILNIKKELSLNDFKKQVGSTGVFGSSVLSAVLVEGGAESFRDTRGEKKEIKFKGVIKIYITQKSKSMREYSN